MLARAIQITVELMMDLGLTWSIMAAGFIGALLSLLALDATVVTARVRIVTVTSGIALSWFGAPAVGNYWDITKVPVLAGIAMVLGIYGLAIVKELSDFIRGGALRRLITTFFKLRGKDL